MTGRQDYGKVEITHIMADKSVRKNLKGYNVMFDRIPMAAREILIKMLTGKSEGFSK